MTTGAPTTDGIDLAPGQTGRVLRRLRGPFLAFCGSLLAVMYAAGHRFGWATILPVTVLAVCAHALDRRIHAIVAEEGDRTASWWRVLIALAIGQIGLDLMVIGLAGQTWEIAGVNLGGLLFAGIAFTVLAFAGLLSEARMFTAARRWPRLGGAGISLVWPVLGCFAVAAACTLVAVTTPVAMRKWAVLVLVTLLLAEIGTELQSEWVDGWRWKADDRRRTIVALVGVVTVVATGVFLVSTGMQSIDAIRLAVVLLGLAWMAASDNDAALVVVPIMAVMLLWAASPRGVAEPTDHQPVAGAGYYLVLGDSYTSGEGASQFIEGTNTIKDNGDLTNQCRQSPKAWGRLLAPQLPKRLPHDVLFVACSGGVTENISVQPYVHASAGGSGPPVVDSPAELAVARKYIEAHGLEPPRFIILGVGGNDAGFSKIGATCVGPGSCATIAEQFVRSAGDLPTATSTDQQPEPLADITDDLDRAYSNVTEQFPGVPVVVTAYPLPVNPTYRCTNVLLDRDERTFVNDFVRELNLVIASVAQRHGFLFLDDLQQALLPNEATGEPGHRLCDHGAKAGLNFVGLNPKVGTTKDFMNPKNWTHNSLHPNEDGHRLMAAVAAKWFAAHADELTAPTPHPDAAIHEPQIDLVSQCTPAGATHCLVAGSGWSHQRIRDAYRRAIVPLGLIVIGWWLALFKIRPCATGVTRWVRARAKAVWARLKPEPA